MMRTFLHSKIHGANVTDAQVDYEGSLGIDALLMEEACILSGEKVELSERASYLNKIREIVQKTPDIREEKVTLLREKIASGSYNVSGQEIAGKMIRESLVEEVFKP